MSYTPAMPTNNDDIIDSRDVIYWIKELESFPIIERSPQAQDDLDKLYDLQDEAEHVEDWEHGENLIRDSYFEEYAEQLAEEIGAIDRDASWPLNHIDWTAAAEDLQQDYTSVEFDGVKYWIRN